MVLLSIKDDMENPSTVMIIDDEESLRSTLTRVLMTAGINSLAVSDGRQAISMLNDNFNLVFLDIHLPHMDGIETLRGIRRKYPKLPVIMLTGHGSLQSAVDSMRLGATDYLLKPVDPEVLVARTRVVLSEQATERRKEQILAKIKTLQAELQALEKPHASDLLVSRPIPSPQERFLKLGFLILDLQTRRATLRARVLELPPASFDYLVVLARKSPEVVDYRKLVTEAQQYQVSLDEARELAKWHVHVLRAALELDPQAPCHLINVRGKGYRLIVD
jgi:DNA-binding response OmpR family regulator